jgi:hypothetical protein
MLKRSASDVAITVKMLKKCYSDKLFYKTIWFIIQTYLPLQRNPEEKCFIRPFCRRKDEARKRVSKVIHNHQKQKKQWKKTTT